MVTKPPSHQTSEQKIGLGEMREAKRFQCTCVAIPSDVLKNDSINKITHNLNSIKSENHDSLPTSSYSIIDMYTQQYNEDYKQFKRAAAAERYARAKDYFNHN